jgi:excisionase family DNA binding protein
VEAGLLKVLKVVVVGERRLLSVEAAAIYLSLSKREVYNVMASGELKFVHHERRKMLDIRDLDEWIERKKR